MFSYTAAIPPLCRFRSFSSSATVFTRITSDEPINIKTGTEKVTKDTGKATKDTGKTTKDTGNIRKHTEKVPKVSSVNGVHGYKRATHPTSVPLNKLFLSQFPLSIRELINDYSYRDNPLQIQHDLLLSLPFFPEPDLLGKRGDVVQTALRNGHTINEFVIYPPALAAEKDPSSGKLYRECNHLFMIHGYGGGLGFFLKNFDAILSLENWVVHNIDLLGYGCSSRPPFTPSSLESVESWFHDSFHEWLTLKNLDGLADKTLVMAHSMGAYLMATYGINKDPNFCRKLLMVSPGAVIKHRKKVYVPSYFAKLWEQNISPFTLVRKAGPLGSKLVSMWSSRRFAHLPKNEQVLLHRYAYTIFQSPGSGEYMLNYLLAPGADARHPLIDRGIHKLNCKMLWCYGEEDWMDVKGGQLCTEIINDASQDKERSTVCEIPNSGHHIYLDNIEAFNDLVLNEMKKF